MNREIMLKRIADILTEKAPIYGVGGAKGISAVHELFSLFSEGWQELIGEDEHKEYHDKYPEHRIPHAICRDELRSELRQKIAEHAIKLRKFKQSSRNDLRLELRNKIKV